MPPLLYRPDIDDVRDRLTRWWRGEDLGRPVVFLSAPREEPLEPVDDIPPPPGWTTDYSVSDFDYRVHLAKVACARTVYMGEAVPCVVPELGPNTLSLYLGARAIDGVNTVWFEPWIDDPDAVDDLPFDKDNFYWRFTLRLLREQKRVCGGKTLFQFPDLIEGLDTLSGLRGTEPLLMDLIERPDWVKKMLGIIERRYFEAYNALYDEMKDERGGSHYWMWAPGKVAKLQCDFSAMISPEMFAEFMMPTLRHMTERLDYSIYHWDGPGALAHHDHLLSLERLDTLQWTPGAGVEPTPDPRWWPIYHKTLDAGKNVLIGGTTKEELIALKKEFGRKLNRFVLGMRVETVEEGEKMLALASE